MCMEIASMNFQSTMLLFQYSTKEKHPKEGLFFIILISISVPFLNYS